MLIMKMEKCIQEDDYEENKKVRSFVYKYDDVDKDCLISHINYQYSEGNEHTTGGNCQVTRNEKGLIKSLKVTEGDYVNVTEVVYDSNNYVADFRWKGADGNESASETYTFKQTDEYGSGEYDAVGNYDGDYTSKDIIKYDSHSNLILKYSINTEKYQMAVVR